MSEATATEEAHEPAGEAAALPADEAPVAKLGQRDGAIALAALALFGATDAWHVTSGLGFATVLSVVVGIVVGVSLGSLAHEWGHFAGARWSGGIAPTKPITSLFPIFNLDLVRSGDGPFRAMSIGGNVAHWLVVVVLALALPLDAPGRVALVSAAFGFAVFASTTELPVIRRSYAGATPIESFRGLTGEVLKRNQWIGAAAGLALFAIV